MLKYCWNMLEMPFCVHGEQHEVVINLCRCRCTEGKAGRRMWATQYSFMAQLALLWLLLELLGYASDNLPNKQYADVVYL